MNRSSVVRKSSAVVEIVLIALLTVSCGSAAPAAGPAPTGTPVPLPTPTVSPLPVNGQNAQNSSPFPEAAAPQRLDRAVLPVSSYRINSQFRSLQWRLTNRQRTPQQDRFTPNQVKVAYGLTQPAGCAIVGLSAMNVSTGDDYPRGWTADQFLADYASGGDWEVEEFGRDGQLFWVKWTTTCSSPDSAEAGTLFMLSWGNQGSPWVFEALAGTPQERDELVAAFVAAFR